MSAITVYMKNGTIKNYPETSRAGGSWSTRIKYEGEFAIITDAYEHQTAIPSTDIERIEIENLRHSF